MIDIERQRPRQWPWWRLMMVGLNILALALSVILSWHFLEGSSMFGCGGEGPCEQVLNSRWSTIAGVLPVSSLAMGVYLATLISGFFIGADTDVQICKLAWNILLVVAGAIAGSAIWFFILQKWVIGDFCPYCMAEHITGILLSVVIIWKRRDVRPYRASDTLPNTQRFSKFGKPTGRLAMDGPIFIGLLLSLILAASQIVYSPKIIYQTGRTQAENLADINYHNAPIIGSPDAPYVVKVLFDYQCPHCQKIHFMFGDAVRHYAGKLAFVLCPAPLNTGCNPYISRDVDAFKNSCELARIGLAVWYAKPDAFADFENWMFTYETGDKWKPRSLESAEAKAIKLVGEEKFKEIRGSDLVSRYLQSSIQLYGETMQDGKGGIPKLVYGSRWVIPEAGNENDLIAILQNNLGLPKPTE